MGEKKHVVIVGGGITGLTAAYYLQKRIQSNKLPLTVQLIEASDRLGGKLQTLRKDGFTIERGPDSFLARKKPAVKLAEELRMTDQLVRNSTGQSYVLVKDKLYKIPHGSFMGVPTQVSPFMFSRLFSLRGKLRATLDMIIPKGKSVDDQSLGHFLRRRFGHELVDHLIEPLLSGIYSGDINDMSLMATFPQFYRIEQEHRSLIKGLQHTIPKRKRGTGKRPGQFYTYKKGIISLVDELKKQVDDEVITLNNPVDHVEKKEHGYHVLLSNGDVQHAHAIIMTTPHLTLPTIFSQYDFFKVFHQVPATSVANVALAFDQKGIKHDVQGTGYVVSRNSDFRITACTWTHKKWPHTTPEGKVLLRSYVGKPTDQDIVHASDEDITKIVLHDLKRTMNITQDPEFAIVTRWKHMMPQYTVGHRERIQHVKQEMTEQLPGIFLAGSSFEGVGIPDCIEQGERAVSHVLDYMMI